MGIFKKSAPEKKESVKAEIRIPVRSIPKPKPAVLSPVVSDAMEEIIGLTKQARKHATPDGQNAADRIGQIARQIKSLGV